MDNFSENEVNEMVKKVKREYHRRYYHTHKAERKIIQNNYYIRLARKALAQMKPYDKQEGV